MRSLISIILILSGSLASLKAQDIYKSTGMSIDFFSSAPLEDIEARSGEGISLWNTHTGEISFRVSIRSFDFEKGKMQEHFNENFMESHLYPYATFKGRMQVQPDLSRTGESPVILQGRLQIHGVEQERNIDALVKVMEEKLELHSRFNVAVTDHDIRIPKLLFRNIAEVVRVDVNVSYEKLEP